MFRNYNGKVVEFRGNQEVIYNHLKTHVGITALEALGVYGIFRLAPRICELRSKGVPIISVNNTDSKGRQYSRYSIPKDWKEQKDNEKYHATNRKSHPWGVMA